MKKFDSARFQSAFEKSPDTFHATVTNTLERLAEFPRRSRRPYRVAILAACLILLFAGVSVALINGTAITDFLGIPSETVLPVAVNEFSIAGEMEHLNVAVREVIYDGLYLRMTVAVSLKDTPKDSLFYKEVYETPSPEAKSGDSLVYYMDIPSLTDVVDSYADAYRHFNREAALKGESIFSLAFSALTIPDSNGNLHNLSVVDYRYESPTSLVLLVEGDLRGEDRLLKLTEPQIANNVAYPNPLIISLQPRLDVFFHAASDEGENESLWNKRMERGEFSISVSANTNEVKKYRLMDYPKRIEDIEIVHTQWTETPLAYYLRIDMEKPAMTDFVDYSCYLELYDKNGKHIPLARQTRLGINADGVDSCYELLLIKEGNEKPVSIAITPLETGPNDEAGETVVFPIVLQPLD